MKRLVSLFVVVAVALFSFVVTGCSKVPAGYVGQKVYLLGGKKGVDTETLGIGRYWIGINEELYLFPIFMQNVRWTEGADDFSPTDEAIRFQDKNGMTLTADLGFSYTINEKKVPDLFKKHRKGIEEITNVYLRNIMQNAVNVTGSIMEFSDINGKLKQEFVEKITDLINKQISDEGFKVHHVTVLAIRPSAEIASAIENKMKAQQDALQAKADAEATVTRAKAEAEAIRIKASSVNETYVRYEQLKIQSSAVEKWDGTFPDTWVGFNSLPFLNIKPEATK